jgi:hypothetical protein
MVLCNTKINLDELLKGIMDIMEYKCKSKKIDINYIIDTQVPKILLGDYIRIQQILINLYNNSIKFVNHTGNGKIITNVQLLFKDSNKVTLKFSVIDNGIGVDDVHKPHLFKSYNKLFSKIENRNPSEGIGLSLSICKKLCELMGGKIWLEESYGNHGGKDAGTIFSFTLTLDYQDENYSSLQNNNMEKIKILILDPDYITRLNIVKILNKINAVPYPVSTLEEAFIFLGYHPDISIVITNLLDNCELVADKLKSINNKLKLIGITGKNDCNCEDYSYFITIHIREKKLINYIKNCI